MNSNIYDDLLSKIEVQIKQAETNMKKEKESVLLRIECMMEGAVDKIEIASLDKQYEKVEKRGYHSKSSDNKILNN